MATSLITTKLSVPPVLRGLVRRARLLDRLDEGARHRLTLLSAPAGSGKTTLLAEWAAATRLPVAWVSLDEHDNDPHRFWTYILTALEGLRSATGTSVVPPSGLAEASEDALAEWVGEVIVGIRGDFLLVLDDYHLIANPALHRGLAFLLDHSPAEMHVVIATRQDPPLPLALLRARDQLVEVRAGELGFTTDESTAFLQRMTGLAPPTEALTALQARTEGWAAGLQLAGLAMRGRTDLSELARTFAGTHRFVVDYLAEQVLLRQDPRLQRFLLATSVLDRLGAPLCEEVTGEAGGQATLEALERANLFLVPLDDDRRWYRYHQLFADFLQDRLRRAEPDAWLELNRRAARWLERQGEVAQAFEHWVRADASEEAARLAEQMGRTLLDRGERKLLAGWLEQLPGPAVRERPWLGVYRAWLLALTGEVADLEGCLGQVERCIPPADALDDLPRRALLGEVAAVRAYAAVLRGEAARARALAQEALEHLSLENRSVRSVVYMTLGFAGMQLNEPRVAEDAFREAATTGREAGNLHVAAPAAYELAEMQVRQGRLHQAMATYQDAMRLGAGPGAEPLPVTAEAHAGAADVLYQWNDLEGAARHAEQAVALSRRWGLAEPIYRCSISLAWICRAQGYVERARAVLDDVGRMMRQSAVLLQAEHGWAAFRLRWWVAEGQYGRAARFVEDRSLTLDAELTYVNEAEYAGLARLLLAQGKADEALRLLDRLLRAAESAGRVRRVIEVLVLQALTLAVWQVSAEATRTLARALAQAEPEGYVRLFVDEGLPMARLLVQARRSGDDGLADYTDRLLAAFGQPEGIRAGRRTPGLIEPLGERELQVLRLIAAGRTYQEIARELIIAVSTVQHYVRSLYPKLGVHSGLEAVGRARELGLLP